MQGNGNDGSGDDNQRDLFQPLIGRSLRNLCRAKNAYKPSGQARGRGTIGGPAHQTGQQGAGKQQRDDQSQHRHDAPGRADTFQGQIEMEKADRRKD